VCTSVYAKKGGLVHLINYSLKDKFNIFYLFEGDFCEKRKGDYKFKTIDNSL
jgi:hypothetical protein